MRRALLIRKIYYWNGLILSILALLLLNFQSAIASTLDQSIKQREYYAAQAAEAKRKAEQKQREAEAVKNQISVVENRIVTTENAISDTEKKIMDTQLQIDDLSARIADEEENLAKEKDKLGKVVASWYMEGEEGLLTAIIGSNNLSEMMTRQEYYDSIRQQIDLSMGRIDGIKAELKTQKSDTTSQLLLLQGLKTDQVTQQRSLESQKTVKSRLLNDTTAMISELKDQEQEAKQKVAELQAKIDQIIAASVGTGGDLVSATESSWFYTQTDDRWRDNKIGDYATIGLYGCLLTSLTMISKYYGNSYTPATAANASSFVHGGRSDGALLHTPIVSDGGSQPINWGMVDSELAANHPVVVGIAMGIDMGNSYGVSHFVVLKSKMSDGRYAMHDPLGEKRGYRKEQVKAMRVVRP